MRPDAFDVLIGLRLRIVRRAADMLGLHFGEIRPHHSGEGTVGDHILHVQCPWRFDGPKGTVTGRDDLWVYAGPGERPANWSYDDGRSLQDQRFAALFSRDETTQSWVNHGDRFLVLAAQQTGRGDVTLELTDGYSILIFPAGSEGEAWRLFASGGGDHLVFPEEGEDFAVSRRKPAPEDAGWEAWLRLVDAPKVGHAAEAPPALIVTAQGTRYRCGRCGTVLLIAEFGALKGFVVRCRKCNRYNEVTI